MRTARTSQKHFLLINISLLSYICTCFGSPPISKLQKLIVHMSGKCLFLFGVSVAVHFVRSYSLLQGPGFGLALLHGKSSDWRKKHFQIF